MLALVSYTASRHRFHSAPLAHWMVVVWRPFRVAHVTRIFQQGHRGWGGVSLLQGDHGVPDVPLQDIYSECRPCLRPPRTPLNGSVLCYLCAWERHPIHLWISCWGGVILLLPPSRAHFNNMMCLLVDLQGPRRQVCTTVRALNPQPLLGLLD